MSENALRTLNAPVGFRFSCLSDTRMSPPTSASSTGYCRSGDTGTYGRIRSRAAAMSSSVMGQAERGSVSGIIGSVEVNVNRPGPVVRDGDPPGLTAYLAVFNVLLRGAASRIDGDLVRLSAVWADHMSDRVRRAVAQWKVFDRVVAIPAHEPRCNSSQLAEELQSAFAIFRARAH